jgi:Cytochrome oxidase c subunit VIb
MADVTKPEVRAACYASRDAYYECLTSNGNDKSKCKDLLVPYQKSCLASWIKYWDSFYKAGKPFKPHGLEPVVEEPSSEARK